MTMGAAALLCLIGLIMAGSGVILKHRQEMSKSLSTVLISAGALLCAASLIYLLSGVLLLGGIA